MFANSISSDVRGGGLLVGFQKVHEILFQTSFVLACRHIPSPNFEARGITQHSSLWKTHHSPVSLTQDPQLDAVWPEAAIDSDPSGGGGGPSGGGGGGSYSVGGSSASGLDRPPPPSDGGGGGGGGGSPRPKRPRKGKK